VKSDGSEVKWEFLFDTAKETQHFLEITPDYGIGCLVFAKDAKLGHDSKDFRPLLTCSMGNESKSSSAIADLGVEVLSVSHQSGAQKRQLICTKYK
jgi:hypothetical protein